ncbi:MAG: FAD-binding protein [Acidimicrobiales bacterium]
MSESLRNDGRIWVPARWTTRPQRRSDPRGRPVLLPRGEVPELRQPRPTRRREPQRQDRRRRGPRRGPAQETAYLDFAAAIERDGVEAVRERYGNLFDMYERITGEDPYTVPMRIYPATHYTMGGLWVDYNLMTTVPGLYALGEANFSDHGANRLGASALMQGLADGYFVLPYTIGDYLAPKLGTPVVPTDDPRSPRRWPPSTIAPVSGPPRRGDPLRGALPPRAGEDRVGVLAAWPATRPASRRHWRRSPHCATSSART